MMPTKSRILLLAKIIHCLLFSIIVLLLSTELILRIHRKYLEHLGKGYLQNNIFQARNTHEVSQVSLWEIPWFKYKPKASFERRTSDGNLYKVHINSHGFRTREFSQQKKDGTIRIISIGGSTTVQGMTNDQTYPAILERELLKDYPGVNVEVLNFGISGTKSWHWVERISELMKYDPDVVIQYNGVNDLVWDYLESYASDHPYEKLLNSSLLYQKLFPADPEAFDGYFDHTLRQFFEMNRMLKEKGVHYVVGSFAAPDYSRANRTFRAYLDTHAAFWGIDMNLAYYKTYFGLMGRYNELFSRFVRKHELNHVMVHEKITKPELFTDVCHMTQDGIKELADAFLAPVREIFFRISKGGMGFSPKVIRCSPLFGRRGHGPSDELSHDLTGRSKRTGRQVRRERSPGG